MSYAHIDDESLIENQKGWVTDFHRALEIRLAQLLGRRPVIWRDPKLQGNDIFDKQIVDQFANVAIMISILTPRYIKSEWCLRELNEFYRACEQNVGFTINNKARVFKIIKTPVRIELHPEIVRNLLGYEFYCVDPVNGRVKEFSHVFGQQIEKIYWEKLNDLANDICSFLEDLDKCKPLTSPDKFKASSLSTSSFLQQVNGSFGKEQNRKKIFLAESTYDTQEFRDSIKRELQDNGYHIYPDRQLPLLAPLLLEDIQEFMKGTDLSIHLVGKNYGVIPEGTSKSIVEIQNDIGSAYSASRTMPRLIWIPEGGEPMDERQLTFIDKLNAGKEGITGADLVKGSLEDFKIIVKDKLKVMEEKEKKSEPQNTAVADAKLIYLICDLLDIEDIKPLEDFLFDNNYEVVTPIFEGDETQIREDHIENLKACAASIIFFGNANELWLRSKMRDFLKINGYGRPKPLLVKAVYLAAPLSAAKQRFRTLEADVINGIEGLPEEKLKNLLARI